MKFFSLTVLAAALCAPAVAQNNRVSLSIGTFNTNKRSSAEPNVRLTESSSSVRILPVIGYHRMLNSRIGLGLELGYSRLSSKTESGRESWGTVGRLNTTRTESAFNEYYICPSIFSVLTTSDKRFRFIPMLGVPVSLMPDIKGSDFTQEVITETGRVTGSRLTTYAPKDAFSVGLIVGGSALYRVAGNLYAGIQLGAGVMYGVENAKGDEITVQNEGLSNPTRYTRAVDEKITDLNFRFQPAIAVNYFF